MTAESSNYLKLIGAHIGLAFAVFAISPLSMVYAILIFVFGFFYIIKTENRNNEVLIVCGYIAGAEVFIRANDGAFFYEFAKYGIILLLFLGMYLRSFSSNIYPYVIFLLLTDNDRKLISFSISGPVCLGVCAIYCFQRRVSIDTLYNILLAVGLPVITLTTYLILYNPIVKDVITGTDSSTATSGGFGPNQVSTAVGLGIFVFLSRTLLNSKSKVQLFVNVVITVILTFRGIVTFSRGGMLAAIIISVVLIFQVYRLSNTIAKFKILVFAAAGVFVSLVVWGYSVSQTNGLIANRYAGQDALGRAKESKFTGREELVESELDIFYKYPMFGCGVGRSVKIREAETGINAASHNEITRLIAEHGFLGILCLFILFATPFLLYFNNKHHFFMISFFLFWLLTINHAAMRIAAPAFIYALCLLQVSLVPISSKSD